MNKFIRHIYAIGLFLFLASCSSQKQDFKIVESYIQNELRGTKYDTVFIRKEAIPRQNLISTYKRMYQYKEHITIEPDSFDNWPFNENEIAKINSEAEKISNNWEEISTDNVMIIPNDVLLSESFFRKHMREHTVLVHCSKPIYNSSRTTAIFYVSGGSFFNHNYIFGGMIIYEKKNGQWQMAAKLQEEVYH